jgi:hypothetical protein
MRINIEQSFDQIHNPVADEECWLVLIETVTTKHTGLARRQMFPCRTRENRLNAAAAPAKTSKETHPPPVRPTSAKPSEIFSPDLF